MHVTSALESACEQCRAEKSCLMVLLDSAPNEGAYLKLQQLGVPFESLFDQTPEAGLLEIAPLLVEATALEPGARMRLFPWLQELAYASPCLSWFHTRHPMPTVAAHLRRFHVVGVSEGQAMLMRWYDTRMLPIWLACLGADQAAAFAAGTLHWQYVNRYGEVAQLESGDSSGAFPQDKPVGRHMIDLNDEQLAMLVGAADLDVLLGHLRRVIPDELAQVDSKRLAAFVSRYQQQAIDYGLKDIDRQTQFVILALYTSGRGIERPELKAFMMSAPQDRKRFSDGLRDLPDVVWNAGPPLWELRDKAGGGVADEDAHKHG
jgi:hypothetical protein